MIKYEHLKFPSILSESEKLTITPRIVAEWRPKYSAMGDFQYYPINEQITQEQTLTLRAKTSIDTELQQYTQYPWMRLTKYGQFSELKNLRILLDKRYQELYPAWEMEDKRQRQMTDARLKDISELLTFVGFESIVTDAVDRDRIIIWHETNLITQQKVPSSPPAYYEMMTPQGRIQIFGNHIRLNDDTFEKISLLPSVESQRSLRYCGAQYSFSSDQIGREYEQIMHYRGWTIGTRFFGDTSTLPMDKQQTPGYWTGSFLPQEPVLPNKIVDGDADPLFY